MDLLDRYFKAGDIVKRSFSDAQSGTVEMTASICDVRSVYIKHHNDSSPKSSFLGFPGSSDVCNVPGSDLQTWDRYCKDDYVICKDWIGRIEHVWEEVTLHLLNGGGTVSTASPSILEEVSCESRKDPPALAYRLAQKGYRRDLYSDPLRVNQNERFYRLQPCYPGQIVRTSASDISRGKWRRGRFNPRLEPIGLVTEVQCYRLQVSWIFPNLFKPFRGQLYPPPHLIHGDLLERETRLYDRSRFPSSSREYDLLGAVYSPHLRFGRRVRWRSGAIGATDGSNPDGPREDSQPTYHSLESHLNVLQIQRTRGTVMVKWQDGEVSKEASVDILPYLDACEDDLWPGDLVCPEKPGEGNAWRSLGVVQVADMARSTAQISWLDTLDPYEERIGATTTDQVTVSFKDVYKYPALELDRALRYTLLGRKRGDLVLVIPDPLPDPVSLNIDKQPKALQELLNLATKILGPHRSDLFVSPHEGWLGEIVAFSLDGRIIVRLGISSTAEEICIPLERVMLVANADDDRECFIPSRDQKMRQLGASGLASENDCSIGVATESSGSNDYDNFSEHEAMNTDEALDTLSPMDADDPRREAALIEADSQSIDLGMYSTRALRFEILAAPAPITHRFYYWRPRFRSARPIQLCVEHEMLSSLLPDGIYVRTWEDRTDLLRLLVIGPYNTAYELAPFVFDFYLGVGFPDFPLPAFFYSWTNGHGQIHPKLGEDGDVWRGLERIWRAPDESKSLGANANLLDFFTGLVEILFKEPTHLPPELGIEVLKNDKERKRESERDTMKIWAMTRGFIKTALDSPPEGLADVIRWLYLPGQDGPCHLERVLVEPKSILDEAQRLFQLGAKQDQSRGPKSRLARKWLDSPALTLLCGPVGWLEGYLEKHQKAEGIAAEGTEV